MKYSVFVHCVALLCILALNEPARGAFWFYGLDGDTISVEIADSIIVVALAQDRAETATTPSELAVQVAGLADDYPFWEIVDGFWVFGVDSTVSAEVAIANTLAHASVGLVNPVIVTGTDRIMWMTDMAIVRYHPEGFPKRK